MSDPNMPKPPEGLAAFTPTEAGHMALRNLVMEYADKVWRAGCDHGRGDTVAIPLAPVTGTVPEGWKMVPIEPDDAQQSIGAQGVRMDTTVLNRMFTANRVYRDMVAAAPAAPAAEPTDEAIEALAHRMAWRYKKSSDPNFSDTYTFNRHTLLNFVRRICRGGV